MKKPLNGFCSNETTIIKCQSSNNNNKRSTDNNNKNKRSFYEFSLYLLVSLWFLVFLFYSNPGLSYDNAGNLPPDKVRIPYSCVANDNTANSFVTNGTNNFSNGMLLETNNKSESCNSSVVHQHSATYKYTLPETSRLEEVIWKVLNHAALFCEVQRREERTASQPKLSDGKTSHQTYLNFDEFRNITRKDKGWGMPSQFVNITRRFDADGTEYNYTSPMKDAKLVTHNKEAKGESNILGKDHDKYLRNPCSVARKFVVIELGEETLVDTVKIAIERMLEDLFVASEVSVPNNLPEPNSSAMPSSKPEVGSNGSNNSSKVQNVVEIAKIHVENIENEQRFNENVANPLPRAKIPDPVVEVRQHAIGRITGDSSENLDAKGEVPGAKLICSGRVYQRIKPKTTGPFTRT